MRICVCVFMTFCVRVCLCVCFQQNLAYEIILTLGQAFEVAYQLALQARKSGHGSSTLPESFDIKPNKPVPKPRVNIRKSVSNDTSLYSPFNLYPLLQPPPQPLTFRQHVCASHTVLSRPTVSSYTKLFHNISPFTCQHKPL